MCLVVFNKMLKNLCFATVRLYFPTEEYCRLAVNQQEAAETVYKSIDENDDEVIA